LGNLSTAIPLLAAAGGSLSATGNITTGIALAISATLTLTGENADLTGTDAVQFAGEASLTIGTAGDLSTSITLGVSANGSLVGTAVLTTAIPIQGQATGSLSASGALTTGIALRATSTLSASGTGVLSTEITLTASATGELLASVTFIDVPWDASADLTLTAWGTLNAPLRAVKIARFIQIPFHSESVS
jgi:hypothetical protein